jgi:hypothetical protein
MRRDAKEVLQGLHQDLIMFLMETENHIGLATKYPRLNGTPGQVGMGHVDSIAVFFSTPLYI